MLTREDVPWSLWTYVVLNTGAIVAIVFLAPIPVAPAIFSIAFILIWNLFLLRGVRWLWIATLVLTALSILLDLSTGNQTWYGSLLGLVGLILLALAPTHRFFSVRT